MKSTMNADGIKSRRKERTSAFLRDLDRKTTAMAVIPPKHCPFDHVDNAAPLELQCAKNAPKLDICVPGARYEKCLSRWELSFVWSKKFQHRTICDETPCTKPLKATETDRNYCLSNYEARLVLVLVFAVLVIVLVKVVVVLLLPVLVIVLVKIAIVVVARQIKYPKFGTLQVKLSHALKSAVGDLQYFTLAMFALLTCFSCWSQLKLKYLSVMIDMPSLFSRGHAQFYWYVFLFGYNVGWFIDMPSLFGRRNMFDLLA